MTSTERLIVPPRALASDHRPRNNQDYNQGYNKQDTWHPVRNGTANRSVLYWCGLALPHPFEELGSFSIARQKSQ